MKALFTTKKIDGQPVVPLIEEISYDTGEKVTVIDGGVEAVVPVIKGSFTLLTSPDSVYDLEIESSTEIIEKLKADSRFTFVKVVEEAV